MLPNRELDFNTRLYGLAALSPNRVVLCSTIPCREEGGADWLYFSLQLGSLISVLPIGAFPFDDGSDLSWRVGLDAWLCRIANHVYDSVRFRLALVGWIDGGTESAATIAATGVPSERWLGYLLPDGNGLRWYPPNQAAPFNIGS
jgi:hypothetical protein